jgi:hypothetical protein
MRPPDKLPPPPQKSLEDMRREALSAERPTSPYPGGRPIGLTMPTICVVRTESSDASTKGRPARGWFGA